MYHQPAYLLSASEKDSLALLATPYPVSGACMREELASTHLMLPQAELCDRLRTAVQKAAVTNAQSMEALRLTVCEFTAVLRQEGTTPEGVLISLKALINDRALPVVSQYSPDWTGYQMREMISTWSIKEFFKKESA